MQFECENNFLTTVIISSIYVVYIHCNIKNFKLMYVLYIDRQIKEILPLRDHGGNNSKYTILIK